ncbi:MAG TPA: hypothetical protein VL547_04730 [Dinghuibacter sp.]|jgi:hypothetical protein|uniref:hypothetical protein n=1 Tax=Dinghuibacter sp. TaxID=2024697 RepID=UPI002BA8D826|nr:hypothetical protein [Dinghuibacter sp.]HTJ11301.1 hypothetical protein [Dinghuibacter sp.]
MESTKTPPGITGPQEGRNVSVVPVRPVDIGAFLPPPALDGEAMKRLLSIAEKYGQKVFPPDYLG